MKKIIIIVIIIMSLFILAIGYSIQKLDSITKENKDIGTIAKYNEEEELVKRVIEIAVVSGKIPDYNLIKDKKNIIISSENIESNLLGVLAGMKFTILTPLEIKEKANKEGDFLYLKFKKIDINIMKATISIDNNWAVDNKSKVSYLSGGGMTITFHKRFGKWIEDTTREMWIS